MYTLRLLGTLSLEAPDRPLTGRAAQGRRLALLAILALARGRALSRDKLVATLWPEASPERARPQLSDALYILRHTLGDDAIRASGDGLALNPDIVTSDVAEMERLMTEDRLEAAVALYRGPLLDGFHVPDSVEFETWLDGERAELDRRYTHALEALAEKAEAAGHCDEALEWWRRRAAHDPYNGRVALRLMRALDAAGDRAGALQHARIHSALLREEFDTEPDAAITALADRLRSEAQIPALRAAAVALVPASPPALEASATTAPVQPDIPEPMSAPGAARLTRRRTRTRALAAVATVVLVAVIGTVLATRRSTATVDARSVGVLPFLNMSADPTNTYFSDGLSEQIILALSRIDGLRVAARTSSFALRDRALNVRAIADTLGVHAVLEGSVLIEGDQLRVIAQLIDARTGFHIWSDQYDGDVRTAFAVQDSIASAIAGALHLRLAGPAPAQRAPGIQGYDLYLRGLYLRNSLSSDGLAQAGVYFDSVIALEPRFALAWAAKATILAPQAYFRYANRDSIATEMRRHAERALALDPNLGEAHAALGVLKMFLDWDWAAGGAELERAVQLNPNDVHALHHLGNYYSITGSLAKALVLRQRAVQLDPLNARTRIVLASDYVLAGEYDRALEQSRRAAQLDPVHPLLLGIGPGLPGGASEVLMRMGRLDEAVEEYLRVATLRGATAAELQGMRTGYAADGMRGFWRQWLAMDLRQFGPSPDPIRMASTYTLIGDTATAVTWLERAFDERTPGLVWLKREPDLAELRKNPRVARIVQAMKVPN